MNYEFGIGITVDPASVTTAADTIGGVITDFENSLTSMAGIDLSQIFGGFDPTLLMPNNDAIEESAATLREIAGILGGIAKVPVADTIASASDAAGDLDKDIHEVAKEMCGVTTCLEEVDEGLHEVTKATEDWGSRLKAVSGFAASTAGQTGNVSKAAKELTDGASQLMHVSVRMEASLGKGEKAAQDFGSAALETAKQNMVTVEAVSLLQLELRKTAVGFDTTTAAGQNQMNTMVKLTESFGMTQSEVASLAGTMKATGTNMTEMTGIAVHFQKKFNVPGLLNQLPKAAKGAMEAQANFGSLVGRSTKDISTSVLRMAGTYSNALGVTAAEAANKALGTFQKFTAEIESYEDLFLGLADNFSPLQTAFLETGMGMEDLQDLMKKGQEDPAAFAEEVKRIRDSMDPQMGQRFFRQVLRNTDEATKALLTQTEAQKLANEQAGKGEEPADPSAVFNKIADAMRKNAVDAVGMKTALDGVITETAKFAADKGIRKGVMAINKVLQATAGTLINQWNELRKNEEQMDKFTKAICGTTGALVGLDTAMGLFNKITSTGGTILVGISSAVGLLLKPFSKLFNFIKGGAKGVGGTGKAVSGFGKIFGKILLPIGIAIAAFDNVVDAVKGIGAIMSDPSKSGMDKFTGVVKEILGAVWGTFDDFFMGLPQKFIDGFMNVGTAVDTSGSESMGKAIGNVLGKGIKAISGFFRDLVETHIPAGWEAVKNWWNALSFGDDIFFPIVSGFAAMGDQILGFMQGLGEGILEAFGLTSTEATETVDALGTIIRSIFGQAFSMVIFGLQELGDGFMLYVLSPIQTGITYITQAFKVALEMIKGAWNVTFAGLEFVAVKIFTGVVAGVAGMGKGLLSGLQTALGGIESIVNSLPTKVLKMMGLEGGLNLTSGIDDQIAALDALDGQMGAMADAAQDRIVAEALGAAARIDAINEEGRKTRVALEEIDAVRRASRQENRMAFGRETAEREAVVGKSIDTLKGAADLINAADRDERARNETEAIRAPVVGNIPNAQHNLIPLPDAPQAVGPQVALSSLANRAGGTGASGGNAGGAIATGPGVATGGVQVIENKTTLIADGGVLAQIVHRRTVDHGTNGD